MNAAPFGAAWLLEQEFPAIRYVVPGIIPEGMTLLVAAPKIGKSWMVLGLALALHSGGEAFGALPVGESRPVLYLALEDGKRRLQSRLRQLRPQNVTDQLQFITKLDTSEVIPIIRGFMEAHSDRDPVVILDTLGKVMPAQAGGPTYGGDYAIMAGLKATCDAVPGSALIIVHHSRKADAADFLDAVSGTQGIAGAADTVIVLKRDRQEARATMQVTSRDTAEGEYSLTLSDTGAWTLDGGDLDSASRAAQTARTTSGLGDRMTDIITKITEYPEGLRANDIATLCDVTAEQAKVYLKRAFDSGRITKGARGLYTPVSSVTSVTSPERQRNTNNGTNTPTGVTTEPEGMAS